MARQVIDQKYQRGALFTAPELVKDYLRTKLVGFEHEVFAALFLDSQHRLLEYVELFRGTVDQASVYPREVVKDALRVNAAAVIFWHNHPSGNPEPSQADKVLTQRSRRLWRWWTYARWITSSWVARQPFHSRSRVVLAAGGFGPPFCCAVECGRHGNHFFNPLAVPQRNLRPYSADGLLALFEYVVLVRAAA